MKPCQFYVNNEADAKHLANKVHEIMSVQDFASHQLKSVELLASGNAIELALKIASIVKYKFNNQIHQIISTKLHLTERGEPLHQENQIHQSQLQWMMKGCGFPINSNCQERFMFAKQ